MSDSLEIEQFSHPLFLKVPGVVQPNWSFIDILFSIFDKEYEESLKKEICKQYGVKYCVLLNDARSGIYYLANEYGLNAEWITSSYMYEPLSNIIRYYCSGLALADINSDFTINCESIESIIGGRSEALLVNHFFGKCSDVRRLRAIADKHNLFLVENCVHVPGGAIVDNKPIGSWGDASIVSFKADKAIGGVGGGALLTNRGDVFTRINNKTNSNRNISNTLQYIISNTISYKFRTYFIFLLLLSSKLKSKNMLNTIQEVDIKLNEDEFNKNIGILQAKLALVLSKKSIDFKNNQIRKGLYLSDLLKDIKGITYPKNDYLTPHTYTYFPVLLKLMDRSQFANRLAKMGIETKWRYNALHSQQNANDLRYSDIANTGNLLKKHILLPINNKTTSKQIDYVAECVKTVISQMCT